MSKERLAFLLGGYEAFSPSAKAFVSACGGAGSRIALLFQNANRQDRHFGEYAGPWHANGATEITLLGRDADGQFDIDSAIQELESSSGIFIGGGHTPTYHTLYATEPVRSVILSLYSRGVPYGGMSAGAKVAARHCVTEGGHSGSLCIDSGLDIIGEIIDVHFAERERLPRLLDEMAAAGARTAYGLDEGTCAIFRDGTLRDVIGPPVHGITVDNATSRQYAVTQLNGTNKPE